MTQYIEIPKVGDMAIQWDEKEKRYAVGTYGEVWRDEYNASEIRFNGRYWLDKGVTIEDIDRVLTRLMNIDEI